MMTTASATLDTLHAAVAGDPFWEHYVQRIGGVGAEGAALHLAILSPPYLQRILEGRKTTESRFSLRHVLPFERVDPGDVLLLKCSGGPISGIARVARAEFLRVTPAVLQEVRGRYAEALGVTDPAFWTARERASYATRYTLSTSARLVQLPSPSGTSGPGGPQSASRAMITSTARVSPVPPLHQVLTQIDQARRWVMDGCRSVESTGQQRYQKAQLGG